MLYTLWQYPPCMQWQKIVQPSPCPIQLPLFVAYDFSARQPHLITRKSSAGARGVSGGMIVDSNTSLPLGWYHPRSFESMAGVPVFRQSCMTKAARWARNIHEMPFELEEGSKGWVTCCQSICSKKSWDDGDITLHNGIYCRIKPWPSCLCVMPARACAVYSCFLLRRQPR